MKHISDWILAGLLFSLGLCGQEFVAIGSGAGAGELSSPGQVGEGPDGNIYVYDRHDGFIKVYSPRGEYLRRMGGKGEGPGLVKRFAENVPFAFTADGKNLFLGEFLAGNRWLTFFDLKGKLVKTLALKIEKNFGVAGLAGLADGSFLLGLDFGMEQPELRRDFYLYRSRRSLVHVSAAGDLLATVYQETTVDRMSVSGSGGYDVEVPFVPYFEWIVLPGGDVAIGTGVDTRLQVLDLQGRKKGDIPLPLPAPAQVTAEDLEAWRQNYKETLSRDRSWYERYGKVIEKYNDLVYKVRPNLGDLRATPEGRILVAEAGSAADPNATYWLIDRRGVVLAKLTAPLGDLLITRSFIFFFAAGDDEESELRCMKRTAGEVADFKRLAAVCAAKKPSTGKAGEK